MKKQYIRIAALVSLLMMSAFVIIGLAIFASYRNSDKERYRNTLDNYFAHFYDQMSHPLLSDNEYLFDNDLYIFGTDLLLSGLEENADMGYYGKLYIESFDTSSVIDMQSVHGYDGEFDINEYLRRQLLYVTPDYRSSDTVELDQKAKQIFDNLSDTMFDYSEDNESVAYIEKDYDDSVMYEFKWKSDSKPLELRLRCVFTYDLTSKTLSSLFPFYILMFIDWLIIELVFIFAIIVFYKVRMKFENRQKALTHGVAHDLKTPLAIVKAYAENWGTINEDERSEYTENLISEVDSMTSIVNNLLYLTRVNSDKNLLALEKVEVMSLVRSVSSKMNVLIDDRDLDIDIVSVEKDGSYLIKADLDMMRVILSNFLSNAIKYSDKKIRITVGEKKGNVVFSIINDGKSIDKKDQKKIWDTFYKTNSSRIDRINSHGLGLAINKSLLELHNAKFGCSSDDTNGTVFWFSMKRIR